MYTVYRLQTGRSEHAMTVLSDGRLCVIGGCSPPGSGNSIRSVEVVDVTKGVSTEVGQLQYGWCINLVCCGFGDKVVVCGAVDDQGKQYIQVWDVPTSRTTHTISLLHSGFSLMNGAVHVGSHLVVVAYNYTCVCDVQDLLQGKSGCVRSSDNYITPNKRCSVVLTSDKQRMMLLGGEPKDGKPTHYVYEAAVQDVINNTRGGWRQVNTPWTLGDCLMHGGYTVSNITLPK